MQPFSYVLVKLASRCNIKCDYCYWFRDASVNSLSAVMPVEVENKLIERLREHVFEYRLKKFSILFHGGEPLLFGKRRFANLMFRLYEQFVDLECELEVSVTTNGIALDEEWIELLTAFKVSVTISLDGPKLTNDRHRVDHKGRGTFDRVMLAVERLRASGTPFGTLAVCDPEDDPREIYEFFKENGFQHFDVLVPDATHDDPIKSIAPFYKGLFTAWYDDRYSGIDIRLLQAFIRGLLGARTRMESIGEDPIDKCIINVDGQLEPLDVLRIAGVSAVRTNMSIFTNSIQDVANDPVWKQAFDASMNLHEDCRSCRFKKACGGGYLPHRWSNEKGYNNPNVYCQDMKDILGHVIEKVSESASGGNPETLMSSA